MRLVRWVTYALQCTEHSRSRRATPQRERVSRLLTAWPMEMQDRLPHRVPVPSSRLDARRQQSSTHLQLIFKQVCGAERTVTRSAPRTAAALRQAGVSSAPAQETHRGS
jgi:hypothetical protein